MRALALIAVLAAFPALADTSKKTTEIRFEDELVQGRELNPDLMLTLSRPQFNGKRLIYLRENFLSELRADAKAVRRK